MTELTIVANVTVVLTLALAATGLLRRCRAALRALLLASAIVVALAMPMATAIMPPRAIHVPVASVGTLPTTVSPAAWAGEGSPGAAAAGRRGPWPLPSGAAALRGVWLLGVAMVLIRLVAPLRRLRMLRRTGRTWRAAEAVVEQVSIQRRSVEVVLHDALSAPMTFGVRYPVIGLPLDAPEWPAAGLRHALIHEVAHIQRNDWLVQVIGRIVCAIYWFHPLAWLVARRLRLECERACDDAVLRHVDRATYAEQLVTFARRLATHDLAAALSMAAPSQLATRVRAVLDGRQARGPAGMRATLGVVALAAALVLTMAPLRAVPASPQQSALTVDPKLVFEVVSVKPNQPGERGRGFGMSPANGRVRLRNQTLRMIVSAAYAQHFGLFVPEERLSGGPDWFHTERFTIEGRAGRAVSTAELGAMLRAVLAQRFNLKMRVETRQEAIHALVRTRPGSLGPELKQAAVDCEDRCGIAGGSGKWQLVSAPMHLLGLSLSEVVGTPVVDRTGLTGSFDGTLSWTPSAVEHDPFAGPGGAAPAPAFGPSVFTALEEQFGLKLVSARGPVEYFIVEHADRPIPNDAPELDANP